MKLSGYYEIAGKFLFRWRSYLPLIILAGLILDVLLVESNTSRSRISWRWQLFCFGITLLGEIIRIIVNGTVPAGTSGRGTKELKAAHLNVDGFYSMVRHPLYLGNYFMWIGASLFFQKWYFPVIIALIFLAYYWCIIKYEERFLESKFGDEYKQWSAKVPALIPSFKNYIKSALSFSLKASLKKEHDSVFASVAIFYFFDIVHNYKLTYSFALINNWFWLFMISTALWIILKICKKLEWLDVERR